MKQQYKNFQIWDYVDRHMPENKQVRWEATDTNTGKSLGLSLGSPDDVIAYIEKYILTKAPSVRAEKISAIIVHCGCGCDYEKSLVMSTSAGTSCPDCYDAMSE